MAQRACEQREQSNLRLDARQFSSVSILRTIEGGFNVGVMDSGVYGKPVWRHYRNSGESSDLVEL